VSIEEEIGVALMKKSKEKLEEDGTAWNRDTDGWI
jgi:hypothetical protein